MKCPSGHTGQVWVSETASGSFSAAPRQGKSAPRVAVPPLLATPVRYRLLPGQLGLVRLHLRLKRLQVLPLCCLFFLADFQLLSVFLEVLLQPGLLAKQDILALGGVEQVLQVKEQAQATDRAPSLPALVARCTT